MRHIATNTFLSATQVVEIAKIFLALSDPTRLMLLHLILERELSVGELVELIKTSQPNVSKHLKILADVGLVKRSTAGNRVIYRAGHRDLKELCRVACGLGQSVARERYEAHQPVRKSKKGA